MAIPSIGNFRAERVGEGEAYFPWNVIDEYQGELEGKIDSHLEGVEDSKWVERAFNSLEHFFVVNKGIIKVFNDSGV